MRQPPHHANPQRVATLVRQAKIGDMIARGDLLELLDPYVRRWCGPIALDDGADATQETLIVVLRSLHQLQEPGALFGWVRSIAVREAVRIAKKHPRTAELKELPAPGDPQLQVDVWDVLGRLTPEHRAILILRDLEGWDEKRAAGLLALPVGTAKSRLARARRSFRKEWQS